MDMNWTDEIRDPEPLKRPIYNAADYDTRHGDPYYREHSTRADSLWRLYEESGTSITFDAFADEMRRFLPAGLMTSTVESPRWSAWAIEQIGTLYGTPGTPSSADAVPGFPIFGASNDSSPTR